MIATNTPSTESTAPPVTIHKLLTGQKALVTGANSGIGKGVAIPHARLPELQRPHGLLAKLKPSIEFDAIDGQPVDIVFVLLLPAAAEHEALGALALVARTLRVPEALARLRGAKNASELYAAIA